MLGNELLIIDGFGLGFRVRALGFRLRIMLP